MKPLWFSFALWLILFAATAKKIAPPSGAGGAIIVGISHYKELDSLQFAHRDAAAFAQFLKNQNVPDDNIKLFINQDATRFNIVDEIYNLTQKLQKGDKFFFYFTGHGDLEAKIGYENSLLLLHGCGAKNYFQGTEYLQLSELRTWFGELSKKGVEVIFIADACHSGGLIGGKEGLDKTQRALQESWQGITKILSSQANEYSLEGKQWGGGRGIFSYFLVNGLTGRADANKDKKVSLKELDNYLKTNVVREANPNTQTPVIQGNAKQTLSQSSEAGLQKLAEDERLSFPIITEANLKAADPMAMIGGLDNSLVETYKKFEKAITEKRLNTFDNEKDYALLHYRKLAKEKVPEHLLAIMKRNLGAALMERELAIMSDLREKAQGTLPRNTFTNKEILPNAIQNLKEIIKIFGEQHFMSAFLQARVWVLESQLPSKSSQISFDNKKIDERLEEGRMQYEAYKQRQRTLLLQSLKYEPNMVSTYSLLSTSYRGLIGQVMAYRELDSKLDSALFYQAKVVELLPNQGLAHLNLANTYAPIPYTTADNKSAPQPKAIEHYEKAILLDSTLRAAYSELGNLYMGLQIQPNGYRALLTDERYRNYHKAISCFEKLLKIYESDQQKLIQKNLTQLPKENVWGTPVFNNFMGLTTAWTNLYFLHQISGDSAKAQAYLQRMSQEVAEEENSLSDLFIAMKLFDVIMLNEDFDKLKLLINFHKNALVKRETELKHTPEKDLWLVALKYKEQLKGLGATYAALKNYKEAEKCYNAAIDFPIPLRTVPYKIVLEGTIFFDIPTRGTILVPNPHCIQGSDQIGYSYQLDAYIGMFIVQYEQNNIEKAFEWLEKAFQQSAKENGNDISGKPFEEAIFNTYPTLDQARFKALKAKYFPLPDTKK